jgi:hypothetical protein
MASGRDLRVTFQRFVRLRTGAASLRRGLQPFPRRPARAGLLALAALLGGCVSHPSSRPLPPLDPIFRFSRPHLCEMAEPLEGLFGGLSVWDEAAQRAKAGPPVALPGIGQRLIPRLRRVDREYVAAAAPLSGRWLGLTVTGIETVFIPESDVGWRSIHFADPPGTVTAALNRAGFGLAPRTRRSEVEFRDETPSASATLAVGARRGGGSTFVCAVGE